MISLGSSNRICVLSHNDMEESLADTFSLHRIVGYYLWASLVSTSIICELPAMYERGLSPTATLLEVPCAAE